jgi:uncharacterized protein (DUF1330 family)
MMSFYFLAGITIHDHDMYQKYLEEAGEVFSKYKGTYLAVDTSPEVVEGDWVEGQRAVLIRFDSREDFVAWYHSSEYQDILKYRMAAAQCNTILVNGLDGP